MSPKAAAKMTADEARKVYETTWGAVTDEEWGEISTSVEDWDAFLAAKIAAAEDAPAEDPPADDPPVVDPADEAETPPAAGMSTAPGFEAVASMMSEMETMRTQMASMTEIVASLTSDSAETKQALRKAKWTGEITGAMFEVDGKSHRIAASGVEVLASLGADLSDENFEALLDHLKLNGGKLCLIPTEIAAALVPGAKPVEGVDGAVADLSELPDSIAAIQQISATHGISLAQARNQYFKKLTGG